MSVLGCTTVFHDVVSLGSVIFSYVCLTVNFSFVGIKWRRFLIIKLPFSFKTFYERGRSFQAITDPILFQVFFSSVLILTVSPDFKVVSRFWVSRLIAVSVVEGLGYGLTECRLVRIGQLNNLELVTVHFR